MARRLVMALFLLAATLQAQDRLEALRREINEIEAQILDQGGKEKTALESLQDLDRQLGLRRTLLGQLETESRKTQRQITRTRDQLDKTLEAYDSRKTAMADRMVRLYKQGRMSDWEALLSLSSLHQLSVWIKYHQRVLDHDQRNLAILRTQRDSILVQQQRLSQAQDREKALIAEAQRETRQLERQKAEQDRLLSQLRQDTQSLKQRRDQKLATYNEIKRMIAQQKERKVQGRKSPSTQFAAKKGKLDWPVSGQVVTQFGTNRDPLFQADYESAGIEIKAGSGEVVRVVAAGDVKVVTWQRSTGNIVIVDHGDGYNTVYYYLDQVLVEPNDVVAAGQIIGRVGEHSSLNGSILHFQVWKNEETVNPRQWLKRR